MTDPVETGAEKSAPAGEQAGQFSRRRILTIFSGLMLSMFLASLDQTIISTSIKTIADSLHGLSLQAWATTAYLVTSTISIPIYGKLSDLYGRRPLYLLGSLIFVVGSLACAFSQSIYQLAVFRAVQGVGAGGPFVLIGAVIGDIVPARQRAKYQGLFTAVFTVASVAGPLIGGLLAGQAEILHIAGWRWVFLVNVPLGLITLMVLAVVLKIPHHRREHRVDWWGALTLVISLLPLLIVAEQGRGWGWTAQRSVVCYAVGGAGLVLFLLVERRVGDDALLPLRLFRSSIFRITSLGVFLVGTAQFSGIALIPLYLQIVKGASPTEAGLLTIPMMLGSVASIILFGQIAARTGRYKIFPVIGTLLLAAGALLFHSLGVDAPLWRADTAMAVLGLGVGASIQPLALAVQNALPARDLGAVTASNGFFRQMGATVGAAMWLSVMFSTVPGKIAGAFRDAGGTTGFQAATRDPAVLADPANRKLLHALHGNGGATGNVNGVLDDSSFLKDLDPRLARPFLVGFEQAMNLAFLLCAGMGVLTFLTVVFLKEIPLQERSGLAQQAAERAREQAETAPDDETGTGTRPVQH